MLHYLQTHISLIMESADNVVSFKLMQWMTVLHCQLHVNQHNKQRTDRWNARFICNILHLSQIHLPVMQWIKYKLSKKAAKVFTCAKVRTGWSPDTAVDDADADGEAVRDGVCVNLEESSSSGDSLPAESEADGERGWVDHDDWYGALFGDAQRLAWHACWPERSYISSNMHFL